MADQSSKMRQHLQKLKEKLKERKALGHHKIKGVDKPKKKGKKRVKMEDEKRTKQEVQIGPRGGKYKQTQTGQKEYTGKKLGKSLTEELLEEVEKEGRIKEFIQERKKNV